MTARDAGSPAPDIAAAIGIGRAHVLTAMNRFDEALEVFKTTKEYSESAWHFSLGGYCRPAGCPTSTFSAVTPRSHFGCSIRFGRSMRLQTIRGGLRSVTSTVPTSI